MKLYIEEAFALAIDGDIKGTGWARTAAPPPAMRHRCGSTPARTPP